MDLHATQRKEIDQLSTDEISRRLGQLERKLDEVRGQYDSLQQIISPSGAQEILTVARLRDTIFGWEEFAGETRAAVTKYAVRTQARVDRILV